MASIRTFAIILGILGCTICGVYALHTGKKIFVAAGVLILLGAVMTVSMF